MYSYFHDAGRCSITGGVVHRGPVASLFGRYLFGDFCTGEIWALAWDGGAGAESVVELTPELRQDGEPIGQVVGFGEDAADDTLIVTYGGRIFRIVSRVDCGLGADSDDDGTADRCECGDADANGRVDTADERRILRYVVGQTDSCGPLCDADGDGAVSTADARRVLRYAVGQIPKEGLSCARKP